ncbi:hypothetical protein ACFL4E_02425 [Candidatus Omnitrophota bacterium]
MVGLFRKNKGKRFGEIAVASQEDIKKALDKQKEYIEKHNMHKEIGAILNEHGVLTNNDVKLILQAQKGQASMTAWFYALFGLSR